MDKKLSVVDYIMYVSVEFVSIITHLVLYL